MRQRMPRFFVAEYFIRSIVRKVVIEPLAQIVALQGSNPFLAQLAGSTVSYHPIASVMVSMARAKVQSLSICRPFLAQLAVSTVKTTAADLVVQTFAEKKHLRDIDLRRTAIFAGFGFAYLGCFQWYLLINKYSKWFPTMKHFAALPLREKLRCKQGLIEGVKMVIFDVVVHSPMIYFPSYYTLKEFVGGSSWSPTDWVKYGLRKYYMNARQDLSAMAVVTIPSGKYNCTRQTLYRVCSITTCTFRHVSYMYLNPCVCTCTPVN